MREIKGVDRRRRSRHTQARIIREQRQYIPHIILGAERVLQQLVGESFGLGPLMPVLLVLPGLLVVRETDDIIFSTENDVFRSDEQRRHVTTAVLHRDEIDRMSEATLIHCLTDVVDFRLIRRDVQVGVLRQIGKISQRLVQQVEEIDVVDERRTHRSVPVLTRIDGTGWQHVIEMHGFCDIRNIVCRQYRVPYQIGVVIGMPAQILQQFPTGLTGGLVEIVLVFNEEGTLLEHRASVVANQGNRVVQHRIRRTRPVLVIVDI